MAQKLLSRFPSTLCCDRPLSLSVSMKAVSDPSSLVRLNIGGKKFRTTLDTLTQREPDSMLAAMFSGRHTLCQDPDEGSVFLDRDGKHFRHILNWLRDGIVPTLPDSEIAELLREAEYYQLLGLIDGINDMASKKKEDEEPQSELNRVDIIKCIQSEKVRLRGVNLSGLDLSKLDLSYVDFSYASLKNVFFSRANLQCAKFRDADAEGSIFHNATLREYKINTIHLLHFSNFLRTAFLIILFCLERCEFTGANLRGALLAAANLQNACLVDCSFCGADLRSAHLQGADLTNANLEGANLEGANLKGAKLPNANLKSANLQRAYLRYVNLKDTVRGLMEPIYWEQSDEQ
ncbi:FH protein interacting protein FIP2, partial [Cucurbita argyrosperma subsp. argyrosperma]